MEILYTTLGSIIQEEVIKNLLSAHKRITETEDAMSIIQFTKYLLHIANKYGSATVNVTPKDENSGDKSTYKIVTRYANNVPVVDNKTSK